MLFKIVVESSFNYPNFQESWAHCYRLKQLIRGSNTNTFVEAQFNILKDGILKRCKEYNINGLLDKLLNEFNSLYQGKLLSLASGTFDGIYRRRCCGKDKHKTTEKETRFCLPSDEQERYFLSKAMHLGNSVCIAQVCQTRLFLTLLICRLVFVRVMLD